MTPMLRSSRLQHPADLARVRDRRDIYAPVIHTGVYDDIRKLVLSVTCHICGAQENQPCTDGYGRHITPHTVRETGAGVVGRNAS